jgi:S-adenosylmethionine hydrolase
MPNGKPGDHPYTDIVTHGRDVYSHKAASLVRDIARFADEKTRLALGEMLFSEYNEYSNPDIAKLEGVLTELRGKVMQEARARGYETGKE